MRWTAAIQSSDSHNLSLSSFYNFISLLMMSFTPTSSKNKHIESSQQLTNISDSRLSNCLFHFGEHGCQLINFDSVCQPLLCYCVLIYWVLYCCIIYYCIQLYWFFQVFFPSFLLFFVNECQVSRSILVFKLTPSQCGLMFVVSCPDYH